MFILKVLGGASLEGPDGLVVGRPAQKRRIALLALLAMSRTNRLGREKLMTYLWPERDGESARHLLSDAVYVVNRALGADALATVGDEIRLNPERLACDARTFEQAAAEDPDAAVRLYGGPFLDGFFLDGNEEFESWVSRERERLSALLAAALERLAIGREAAGDHRGAVEAWRRLCVEDPYNSRVVTQLARALERSGDRAGALQTAQAHAALLRKELGLHATPDLRQLIASLQAAPAEPVDVRVAAGPAAASVEPVVVPSTTNAAGERAVVLSPPVPVHARRRGMRLALVGVLAAMFAAAVVLAWITPWRSGGSATPLHSLAVMPFAGVPGEEASQYLGEGIADELTTQLGRQTTLRVAARTSAFALKDRQMDARAIGRTLGVDALLEGSVRLAGDRVRVAVRLVNARDGYQIWSHTWDRPRNEVSGIHEQIAGGVVQVLQGRQPETGSVAAGVRPVPPDAYNLYLQGRYLWHQRTSETLKRAADAFERSVSLAPDYAQAYSGLADAYAVMGFYDYLPPTEAFPRAKTAARRALALDAGLAQAHASLGYVALYYDWNWAEAEAAFERAIALNPSYSVGHQWYANYLTARGRFDEAVAAMRRAQEVDPLSLIASAALGWVHFYARQYDAAVEQCRRTLQLNPRFELAHLWAGWAEEGAGRYDRAVQHLSDAVRLSSDGAVALASLGRAQALAGDLADARNTLAKLRRVHRGYVPAYEVAKLHLALGERDQAMALLRRAHAERSHSVVFLTVDPQLDGLRSDAQFRDLERSIAAPSHESPR